jgi:PAS domain S-box-containing protein
MPDLFSRLTRDGIYLDFRPSPHWKPLFTAEEAIGRSVYDVLPKDLADRRLAYCRQVLDTGEPKLYEYELLEDGDIRHYESRIIVSGTDETLSVVRDVTERKRAEEALRQSERRNEVLLAAMPDLFARLTRDGIYLDFRPSPQWEALFTAEEAIGRSSYDLMPKELADRRLYYCHRALDTGEPQAYEYELVEEDETRHYETRVVVSGPDETLSVVRDITDRKHAEKELRLKNRAIETSLTPICIGDLEGVLTHVNSAFLKLWGYDHKEQVLGRVAQEFWQEPAEATAVIDALHRDGRWMGELVGKRADGSAFKTKVAATVIENERGEPESLMGSFMDVTTERRYQQALHQRTAELSALNALGMALCTCFSVGTVSQAALKHAMRLFDFAFGAVYLLDDTSDEFRLVTHKGLSKEEAAMLHRVRTRDQPFAHTQRMPESGVISLQDRPDSEWARCLHAMGVTRAVAVPLVSRDTIIGSLDLGGGTGLLSGQDISLLTTIGIQIGPNLESAKLFGELERAHRQLQGLSAQLTNTLEEERAHISRELHDEVGQALTALKLTLQIAQDNHQLEAKDGESAVLAPSIDLIDTTVDRVRQIAAGLRADTISDLGLLPALREQVEAFAKRSGIMIQLKMADSEPALSHEAKLALYRIVQEGLTNVAKHADADEVVIQLEEAPETIQVTIQDDGNGFAPFGFQDGRQEEHLGLVGVRERAELLGGRVRIQSKPNAGTSITVRLPKNHKEAKDDHDPGPTR